MPDQTAFKPWRKISEETKKPKKKKKKKKKKPSQPNDPEVIYEPT
jgi:hypothetical protein